MTAHSVLATLRARDIAIILNGDRLKIDAPAGALTDEDRQAVRDHKASLLDLLAPANVEMHDSGLFDVVVEVDFYDGRRIRIPQKVWPEGWECPF